MYLPHRSGIAALVVAAGLCALTETSAAAAPIPSHGDGSPQLEAKVDALVKATIEDLGLPGVSVAVSRKGKLILAKGYGYRNAKTKMPMYNDTNIRIGSVTKAAITGPAAFDVLKKKNIDPKTKKLYGASGVLGTSFNSDSAIGVKRHTPIIETAITPDDKVFTWYRNGKVSKGATNDLDKYSAPQTFSLPTGKKLNDLRAISIAKNGQVFSWWDHCDAGGDNCKLHRAIGTPTDLDKHSGISAQAVQIPKGLRDKIVGIGIAKSNDRVYVWYEDGTYSAGSSMDFTSHFAPKAFSTGQGAGGTSYDIRGVDIAKNDHVYAWFGNGKASSGMSHDLDKYIAPYAYSVPAGQSPNWSAWYQGITLQNLLDHKAGFDGSGDTAGAMKMFGVTENALTYAQVHKHFLRTGRLLSAPGDKYAYSNHGFGLWTLLIEKLTGKAYYPYVRDNYLAPKGLEDFIVPEKASAGSDCRFAWNHEFEGGVAKPGEFEQWGLGLAAGGFRASAMHLARLLITLDGKYTGAQLDQMGWATNGAGKLGHSGSAYGGTAYAAMFPQGYTESGKDLSGIHVVIISNVQSKGGINVGSALRSLATKVALAVPDSSVPATYELPKPLVPAYCSNSGIP